MLPLLLALAQAPSLHLSLMPSGLFQRIGGYAPMVFSLSETKPAELTKAPAAAAPRYGTIKIGDYRYLAMLDGKDKLYVDSNRDGDLTDDPTPQWGEVTYRNGTKAFEGAATIDLPYQGKPVPCRVGLYSYDDPSKIGYYADFALSGKIGLGGQTYDAIYSDPNARWNGAPGGVLMIDKDRDGKFHPGYEFYRSNEPFNVGGTTYELGLKAGVLAVAKSSKTVAERTLANSQPADPNLANGLRAGKAALAFDAVTMGGRTVSFPKSYAGKVVLLDFWATWCGPCMREVPNVAANYRKYHDQGFEVLGVSLDRENAQAQIKTVTGKNGMIWDQVYDGHAFDAAIAKKYGIQAIPEAYLVDGSTGRILACGDAIRGEKLGPAIARALAAKG